MVLQPWTDRLSPSRYQRRSVRELGHNAPIHYSALLATAAHCDRACGSAVETPSSLHLLTSRMAGPPSHHFYPYLLLPISCAAMTPAISGRSLDVACHYVPRATITTTTIITLLKRQASWVESRVLHATPLSLAASLPGRDLLGSSASPQAECPVLM